MGICGGLVGPKSGNVEKALVLLLLFEGSRAARARQEYEVLGEPGRFDVEKVICFIKNALCLYSELCFLCGRGWQFQKIHEKKRSESEKWDPNHAGDVKISPKWGRIHGDVIKGCWIHHSSRPRKPPVAKIHIFATFFEVQLGRHGGDKRGKGRATEG